MLTYLEQFAVFSCLEICSNRYRLGTEDTVDGGPSALLGEGYGQEVMGTEQSSVNKL